MSDNKTIDFFERQVYRRLIDVSLAMSAARDLESLLDQILREARSLTRSDGGTIYLRREAESLSFALLMNNSLGLHQSAFSSDEIKLPDVPLKTPDGDLNLSNVAAASANLGKTIVIDDVYKNDSYDFHGTRSFDQMLKYRSVSFLTVALKNYQDECIGVMQLLNAHSTNGNIVPFDLKRIPLVEALASLASVAIQNRRELTGVLDELTETKDALASLETKDPSTGLHNRRHFDEVVDAEWRRARRQQYEVSLTLMEIDDLGSIASERGHHFASACRRAVANEISRFFKRPSDFVASYDDGTFVVLLPYLSTTEASAIAEKLRLAISGDSFVIGDATVQMTLSTGVATLSPDANPDYLQLIQLAASALAKARNSGGNRTHSAELPSIS